MWPKRNITVAIALLSLASGHAKLCMPDCSGMSEGDKIPDPSNCFQYYYCSDPEGNGDLIHSSEPLKCPEGYYFNAEIHILECEQIVPDQMKCVTLCNPCEVECTSPGTLIPNVYDCSSFRICLDDGNSIDDICPQDLPFFDPSTGVCSDDPGLCYDLCDPCELYCAHEGKVPDPYDCSRYYFCDPPVLSHFDCPSGEAFNPESLLCEEADDGGNCTSLCGF